MFKKNLLFLALGFLVFAVVGCGNNDEEAAAIVNEEVITMDSVDRQVENTIAMYAQQGIDVSAQGDEFLEMIKMQTLDGLITEILLIKVSEEYSVTEEEVNEEYEEIKAGFESEQQFNEVLVANDLTTETLKEKLEQQLKIDQFFVGNMSEVNVTEEEVRELFNEYNEMDEEELDYEEVKPYIEQSLVQQKQEEEMDKLIQQLKDEANIEILI